MLKLFIAGRDAVEKGQPQWTVSAQQT
jgi:hypothetical protein